MRLFTCLVLTWTLICHVGSSPFPGHAVHQGCYSSVDLQRNKGHLLHPFVADSCLTLCSGNGHHRAALDSINSICYCGNDILTQIRKVEDTQCKPCIDGSNLFCGGVLKISLYEIEANVFSNNVTTENHQGIISSFEDEPAILFATHGEIYFFNSTAQSTRKVIDVEYKIDAIDYDLKRKVGFGIWNELIHSFPLFEEAPLPESKAEVLGEVDRCPTFAVDWQHDKIYYPDCYAHSIMVIGTELRYHHGYTVIHLPDEGAWALDMVVDPYRGLLFWSAGATLWSVRLDGRLLRKVVPEFPVNRVSSLALDLAAARVYFSGLDIHDKTSSKLYFTGYNGSMSHSLLYTEYEGGYRILSFGIFEHHLYSVKSIDDNHSVIMTSKLEYNHRPSIYLQGNTSQIKLLKLVHPQLQSPGKEDDCTNFGCSHLCILEDSIPRCHCPRYHKLQYGGKTCYLDPDEEEEEPVLLRAAMGLMLVLLVILSAGVLMCICDKLWSQLHPTVVRLSVPGSAKRSFTGLRMQDGENLI